MKVCISLLSADFSKLGEEVCRIETCGADFIHIDVMDGFFTPNIGIGPYILESLKFKTKLPFFTHLMVDQPEQYIESYSSLGSEIIAIHLEVGKKLYNSIEMIKSFNKKPAIVLNPLTPICLIEEIIKEVDIVLLMSVNPGFPGQKFIKNTIDKIKRLKKYSKEKKLKIHIAVDGGINLENAPSITKAGADMLVLGSAAFKSDDMKKFIIELRQNCLTYLR